MRKFPPFDMDDDDSFPEEPVPVIELPYYETLREILEPYRAVNSEDQADKLFTSAEIIRAIEEHHGVPQGPMGKCGIKEWVMPDDFARAMKHLGFRAVNTGGLQLQWLLKRK
jgi:hypothetical protein